jgi:hypothetical protein
MLHAFRITMLFLSAPLLTAEVSTDISALKAVSGEGQGNEGASAAVKRLSAASTAALPEIITAIDGASPLAANWLRGAADVIAQRAAPPAGDALVAQIEALATDTARAPGGRVLAFDLLRQLAPSRADALVPKLANDPVSTLRRPGVAQLILAAKKSPSAGPALAAWEGALSAARDEDQIKTAAEALKELGHPANLPRHFGFLMDWKVIGPFDNTGRKGFDTVYPPEKELAPSAAYPGKAGEVKWTAYTSEDEFGKIDLNKPLGTVKEVTGYALATYQSPTARKAEIRLGCKNAWKVWLNGQPLFSRDEYHRGAEIDQYTLPVDLRKGENQILVKCCQNEQTESWTVEWEFQLRVCDASGTALLATDRK